MNSPPRRIPRDTADIKILINYWLSSAELAEKNGDSYRAQYCRAAAERFKSEEKPACGCEE